MKNEAVQAILDDVAQADGRCKISKAQELIDNQLSKSIGVIFPINYGPKDSFKEVHMEETIISSTLTSWSAGSLEKSMPSSFKERTPKAFFDEKRDAWMFGSPEVPIGGRRLFMAGQRPEQLRELAPGRFLVARPGGWDPIER